MRAGACCAGPKGDVLPATRRATGARLEGLRAPRGTAARGGVGGCNIADHGELGGSGAACGGGKQSIACGAVTARDACNVELGCVADGYGGAGGASFGLTGA